MPEIDIAETEILRKGYAEYSKEIAGGYVKPLLSENILRVSKDHIQIRNLTVSRERVVFLHIALTQLRSPATMYPVRQGRNGFTVEKVQAARGNDIVDAYRITSNAQDHTSILLTKKLAWELWEVIAFFIPSWTGPLDNPLPKTEAAQEESHAENPEPENFSDDDEDFEEDDENDEEDSEEGPVTFDYTPFEPGVIKEVSEVVTRVLFEAVSKNPALSFGWDDWKVTHPATGEEFVIISSNESEHAEWDEGSEWGEFLTNDLIPALHDWSVKTYNNDDESLDDEFVDFEDEEEVE